MSEENKERLTFLIHASGARIPVISIADSSGGLDLSGGLDRYADATIGNDAGALLKGMRELMARESGLRALHARQRAKASLSLQRGGGKEGR